MYLKNEEPCIIFLLIINCPLNRMKHLLFSIFEQLSTQDGVLSSEKNPINMKTEMVASH